MERELKIRIPKTKKVIYGRLRGSLKRPLLVFVHGLSGHMDEHLFFNGARWFEKHGFSSFRFNLYDWRKGARTLVECTVRTHASDLDVVVRHLRRMGAKRIVVVGHSYGGPTILLSKNQDFDRAVLWDPTATATFDEYGVKKGAGPHYVLPGGYQVLVGKAMYQENQKLNSPKWLRDFPVPTKIILAGKGVLIRPWGQAFKQMPNSPHALTTIPGATHCFDEDGAEEQLFKETLSWIRKNGRD